MIAMLQLSLSNNARLDVALQCVCVDRESCRDAGRVQKNPEEGGSA